MTVKTVKSIEYSRDFDGPLRMDDIDMLYQIREKEKILKEKDIIIKELMRYIK